MIYMLTIYAGIDEFNRVMRSAEAPGPVRELMKGLRIQEMWHSPESYPPGSVMVLWAKLDPNR